MTIKFSRHRGRVQPTPAICKRPPIPQPPGTPLEAMAANLLWLGVDWDAHPFNEAKLFDLYGRFFPDHSEYLGQTPTPLHTIHLVISIPKLPGTCFAQIYLFDGDIYIGSAWQFFPPLQHYPFDSGELTAWTVSPPNTTIRLRVRG